ncbi:hypothetical protein ASPBRDRAFT_359460 [Aspergillus brasiliensis CBS 101740]|uniref:Uncharacterized protein n=1 Tax=Aspergillus brasiliensis (strain CBS 101740 / IMI 381727 / IBT 21946) TaxID=767769 RepID=A0A1L9U5R0_ASPBC|nr:hypothetical protein ASPBRDRAFT_359460 [Aspergillus brasiliensis CBS 101740]
MSTNSCCCLRVWLTVRSTRGARPSLRVRVGGFSLPPHASLQWATEMLPYVGTSYQYCIEHLLTPSYVFVHFMAT